MYQMIPYYYKHKKVTLLRVGVATNCTRFLGLATNDVFLLRGIVCIVYGNLYILYCIYLYIYGILYVFTVSEQIV